MALDRHWGGKLAAKSTSERRLGTKLTVQLPLERRFGTHLTVKLALEWRSWAPLNVKFAKKAIWRKASFYLGKTMVFEVLGDPESSIELSGGSNGSGEVPSDDDFAEHGRWKLHWRPGMPKLGGLWTLKPDFKPLGSLVSPRSPVEPFV